MGLQRECWRLSPLELPRPWRYCPGCGQVRAFICSGRFRTNAQKKVLDVWLTYWCSDCSAVWKLPIFSRCAVTQMDAGLLDGFACNERTLAWKYAFDIARLRPHVARIDTDVAVRVERSVMEEGEPLAGLQLQLAVPFPCTIRLEKMLAAELGVSRSRLGRWHEEGKLRVLPSRADAMRRSVSDGQQVSLSGGLIADARN